MGGVMSDMMNMMGSVRRHGHDRALQRHDAGRPAAQRPVAGTPARAAGPATSIGCPARNALRGDRRSRPAALESNDAKPEADRGDSGAARRERINCCSTFARRARSATPRPREVLPTDWQGSARLRTPGRRRPSGQPRRPPRQGRGPALHLYELPGRLPSARRAHRRDPEDGQPDADARAGAVRHHHHGPRARHAGGDAAVRVGARAPSRKLDLPDDDARPAGGCHAEARRALWPWIHRDRRTAIRSTAS